MHKTIKALIFDMDGVIIDSEPLWRRAMVKAFGENGLKITEDECRKTTGKRLIEVIYYWLEQRQLPRNLAAKIEADTEKELIRLIHAEGEGMPGFFEVLLAAKTGGLKIGLATSSSQNIMQAVLQKLEIKSDFNAVLSAQNLPFAKPHPQVFMDCANLLQVPVGECMVIEDSVNGVIAGKAAQMVVVAVPEADHLKMPAFGVADYLCQHLTDVLPTIAALKA